MHSYNQSILEEREKLYNEVWQEPMVTVAKRYGLSDNGLRKKCKSLNIPLPPVGYWARLSAGKPVTDKPELPPLNTLSSSREEYTRSASGSDRILDFIDTETLTNEELEELEGFDLLTEQSKERFSNWCNKIEVPKEIDSYDKLIISHQNEIAYRKARDEEYKLNKITNSLFSSSKIGYRKNEAIIPVNVSEQHILRAYRIMDTLIKSVKELGGRINISSDEEDTAFIILLEYILSFTMSEKKIKRRDIDSTLNKGHSMRSFRPSYEAIPSGMLILEFNRTYNTSRNNITTETLLRYEDTDNCMLEAQIASVVKELCILALKDKVLRIKSRREKDLKEQEEERLRLIEEEKKKHLQLLEEQKRKKQLLIDNIDKHMESWYKSQKLIKYINELEEYIKTHNYEAEKTLLSVYIDLVREKAEEYNVISNILSEIKEINLDLRS
jgi:hypothetical protein